MTIYFFVVSSCSVNSINAVACRGQIGIYPLPYLPFVFLYIRQESAGLVATDGFLLFFASGYWYTLRSIISIYRNVS
jgi:hypothetical protein